MRWIIRGMMVFALLLGAAAYYCWSVMPSPGVSQTLAAEVRRGPNRIIDFSEIAPFEWDRVFIFHPYTPKDYIERCLGFKWHALRWSEIEWSEGVNLVVFVRNGGVTCWFEHSRLDGEFFDMGDPPGFTREQAKFKVIRFSYGAEERLTLTR
jgi:hypothetical protein